MSDNFDLDYVRWAHSPVGLNGQDTNHAMLGSNNVTLIQIRGSVVRIVVTDHPDTFIPVGRCVFMRGKV